jgi:hypothetical protein
MHECVHGFILYEIWELKTKVGCKKLKGIKICITRYGQHV